MCEENAYLILGCYGRTEDRFVLCPSVENRILKLDDTLNDADSIMNYLDAIGLFDRPLLDNNAIRHLIYNLQDKYDQKIRRIWSETVYHRLERFMQLHKQCGLYARIVVVPESEDISLPEEPDKVLVKALPEKKPELKVIRGNG